MSTQSLPCPDIEPDTPIPTPAEVVAALASLSAVETWPGIWMATLSTGEILRVTVSPAYRPTLAQAVRDAG